jgi:outer membrane protein OmpA-like peptidoglycan-associated protein
MPDSYLEALSNVLPSSAVQTIAGQFGASERTVLSGVQSAIAAVVTGLAQKSNDKGFMGQIAQLASSTPENAVSSCPAVHLKIGDYTDNTGDAAHNLKLSQDRADSVVAQLESMGIAKNRLVAKGYGDQYPVGDNATPDGRAPNRRIGMLVTEK